MDIAEMTSQMPSNSLLGITIKTAADERATGHLAYRREVCFDAEGQWLVHGGIIFALADTTGAAALMTTYDEPRPAYTVDMRIDYLDAARSDLHASAEVVRAGSYRGVVDVLIETEERDAIAIARGVYRG